MKVKNRPSPLRRPVRPRGWYVPAVEQLEDRQLLSAGSVPSQFFYGSENKISDNSGELLWNPVAANGSNIVVGSVIITGFNVATVENLGPGTGTNDFGPGTNDDLNGIAALQVASVDTTTGVITFVPVSAANRAAIGAATGLASVGTALAAWQPGSMVALYDANSASAAASFVRSGADANDPGHTGGNIGTGPYGGANSADTLMSVIAAGTATRLFEFGFTGAGGTATNGENWVAQPVTGVPAGTFLDFLKAAEAPISGNVGAGNLALDETFDGTGGAVTFGFTQLSIIPGSTGMYQLTGNTNFQGTQKNTAFPAATPFSVFDDLNASFEPLPNASITIGPNGTNPVGAPHTFTVTVQESSPTFSGLVLVPDNTPVTVTLTSSNGASIDPISPIPNSTTSTTATYNLFTSAGQVSVTFTSPTAGTITGHASVSLTVYGVPLTRATGDSNVLDSSDAVKTFTNLGTQGLTPGFWKNNWEKWNGSAWAFTYNPVTMMAFKGTDTLASAGFSFGAFSSFFPGLDLSTTTLDQALNFGGGSSLTQAAQILLRQAVAGILNSTYGTNPANASQVTTMNYALTFNQVITQVNSALQSHDRTTILTLEGQLDAFNNAENFNIAQKTGKPGA